MEKDYVKFLDYHIYRYNDKNEIITKHYDIINNYILYNEDLNKIFYIDNLKELFKSYDLNDIDNLNSLKFQDAVYLIVNNILYVNYNKLEIYNSDKTKWCKFIKRLNNSIDDYNIFNIDYKDENLKLSTNLIVFCDKNIIEYLYQFYILLNNPEYFQ